MIKESRPWGKFLLFTKNKKCTVKILQIKPKQRLSLQSHKRRSEFWYFLKNGFIQLNQKEYRALKGDFILIPVKIRHRIRAGKNDVNVLEVSIGKFSEKDEIRYEDDYNRS